MNVAGDQPDQSIKPEVSEATADSKSREMGQVGEPAGSSSTDSELNGQGLRKWSDEGDARNDGGDAKLDGEVVRGERSNGEGEGERSDKERAEEDGGEKSDGQAEAGDDKKMRRKNRDWGYQLEVLDENNQPKKVVPMDQLHNYVKLSFPDDEHKPSFTFFAALIDGGHPRFVRFIRGNRRWRMRYNIFVEGVLKEQQPNLVVHLGELHLYTDIEQSPKGYYRISLRDYQKYLNKNTDDQINEELRLQAEDEWSKLVMDVQAMLQLKNPRRDVFNNRNGIYDQYRRNIYTLLEQVKDFNIEFKKWLYTARVQNMGQMFQKDRVPKKGRGQMKRGRAYRENYEQDQERGAQRRNSMDEAHFHDQQQYVEERGKPQQESRGNRNRNKNKTRTRFVGSRVRHQTE